jgi:hypothetical protein
MPLDAKITLRAKYEPAMAITDQAEADRYFEELVAHCISLGGGMEREQAEEIERSNLGYWAGYHDRETRLRVEELFRCEHPILGKAKDNDWTPEELLGIGALLGGLSKKPEDQ